MCLLAKTYMSSLTESPTLVPKSVESIEWFGVGRGNLSSLFETLTLVKFGSRAPYLSPVMIQVKLN